MYICIYVYVYVYAIHVYIYMYIYIWELVANGLATAAQAAQGEQIGVFKEAARLGWWGIEVGR